MIKYHSYKSIKKYKARIVTQSFLQVNSINYIKIFELTIKQKSLKIFLAIVRMIKMRLLQMYIINTY